VNEPPAAAGSAALAAVELGCSLRRCARRTRLGATGWARVRTPGRTGCAAGEGSAGAVRAAGERPAEVRWGGRRAEALPEAFPLSPLVAEEGAGGGQAFQRGGLHRRLVEGLVR